MWIVFDVDNSLESIGSASKQELVFGCQPVKVTGGLAQIKQMLEAKVLVRGVSKIEHPIFGKLDGGDIVEMKDSTVSGIIIDTLSMAGYQTREILSKKGTMDLQQWGLYGDYLARFLNAFSRVPVPVIMTSHIDRSKDEMGGPMDIPALKGGMAHASPRFFTAVLYTYVERLGNQDTTYSWRTGPDTRRIFAKTRGINLPLTMPQDFGIVLQKYREAGINDPKILILGDSGQGKSFSLQTVRAATSAAEGQ